MAPLPAKADQGTTCQQLPSKIEMTKTDSNKPAIPIGSLFIGMGTVTFRLVDKGNKDDEKGMEVPCRHSCVCRPPVN